MQGIELLLTTDAFYRLQSVRSLSISAGFQLTSPSYFKNGAQINTPMDVEIAQSIEENLVPWPGAWKDQQPGKYLHTDAYQKILPEYTKTVWQYAVSTPRLLVHMLLTHPDAEIHRPRMGTPKPICVYSVARSWWLGFPGPVPVRGNQQHFPCERTDPPQSGLPHSVIPQSRGGRGFGSRHANGQQGGQNSHCRP